MARLFTGAGSLARPAASIIVPAVYPCTFAAWGRVTTATGTFQEAISTSGTGEMAMGVESAGQIRAYVISGGSGIATTVGPVITAGVWFHMCGVFANASDRGVYRDGGNLGTNFTVTSGLAAQVNQGIGRRQSTAGNLWNGALADVAIWSAALSAAEVLSLAKGASPLMVRPQSLEAYWPLYGNNSPEQDVRNNHEMTITPAATVGKAPDHPRVFLPQSVF